MSGPEFLIFYMLWFLLVFVVVLFLRYLGYDKPIITISGLALFLGVGVARWVLGSSEGLHKWFGLAAMMFFGTILFLIRFQSSGGGPEGGSGCSSCSSGSSGCGGGGSCGGGGCGGCGGS